MLPSNRSPEEISQLITYPPSPPITASQHNAWTDQSPPTSAYTNGNLFPQHQYSIESPEYYYQEAFTLLGHSTSFPQIWAFPSTRQLWSIHLGRYQLQWKPGSSLAYQCPSHTTPSTDWNNWFGIRVVYWERNRMEEHHGLFWFVLWVPPWDWLCTSPGTRKMFNSYYVRLIFGHCGVTEKIPIYREGPFRSWWIWAIESFATSPVSDNGFCSTSLAKTHRSGAW